MTESRQLLVEYAENGKESAFRELVARYVDLVYSTALRQVGGDAHLAKDVSQIVFLHLAKKARGIGHDVMLGGWLHQATCNVAATVTRGERRRQTRERQAAEMSALQNDSEGTVDRIGSMLDEVIRQLPEEDRAAVLLRFFEKQDFRAIGLAIGTSEDAARMRVNRALEKLQILLKQRGVTISVAVLGVSLAAESVVAAPPGLAAALATSALAATSTAGPAALLKFMALSNIKLTVAGLVIIGALTTGLVRQHQSVAQLRKENVSLQQQIEASRAAKEDQPNPTVDAIASTSLRQTESELLRLRAEVTALRRVQKLATVQATTIPSNPGAATPPGNPAVTHLQANVRAQVGVGQTLLTGGWTNESGSRTFVMATPQVQGENADQVGIKTIVFEVPAEVLSRTGLDAFNAGGTESSLQQIFEPDQANFVLKQLKDTGARFMAQSSLLTTDGRQAEIRTVDEQIIDGEKRNLGPTINFVPVISSDKTAIDMTVQAGLDRPSRRP